MYSIYHFFKYLVEQKALLTQVIKLEDILFDDALFSCRNLGQFPDLAIKINLANQLFSGGELVELKDSKTYAVASFNSTIPTGKKEIEKVVKNSSGAIAQQMLAAGDDIFSLPIRDVFYLVRGKKKDKTKICLIHGSFFETVATGDLISQSFSQVLEERLQQKGLVVEQEIKDLLLTMFSEQANFSKVRTISKASVKLRFRILTEVKAEGNILNTKKYPQIGDDTLNFLIPCHNVAEETLARAKMEIAFGNEALKTLTIFKLKHHFNGYFLVFQQHLK